MRATPSTAWEVYREGEGVCRDYAHLAIAFCRCLNIPARYCTGYLGDIGTPPPCGTMDFAGWFEAWLGDRWYTFDARNNTPRIGRVLMARGRDACDAALSTAFGPNTLEHFVVRTDERSWPAPPLRPLPRSGRPARSCRAPQHHDLPGHLVVALATQDRVALFLDPPTARGGEPLQVAGRVGVAHAGVQGRPRRPGHARSKKASRPFASQGTARAASKTGARSPM